MDLNLNAAMEFDCPVRVHADGTVTRELDMYAPDLYDGKLPEGCGWTLLTGYTGQYGYNGPIMHQSEFVGGGLARDILAEPGVYVTLVDYQSDDSEAEGWAVARKGE